MTITIITIMTIATMLRYALSGFRTGRERQIRPHSLGGQSTIRPRQLSFRIRPRERRHQSSPPSDDPRSAKHSARSYRIVASTSSCARGIFIAILQTGTRAAYGNVGGGPSLRVHCAYASESRRSFFAPPPSPFPLGGLRSPGAPPSANSVKRRRQRRRRQPTEMIILFTPQHRRY